MRRLGRDPIAEGRDRNLPDVQSCADYIEALLSRAVASISEISLVGLASPDENLHLHELNNSNVKVLAVVPLPQNCHTELSY